MTSAVPLRQWGAGFATLLAFSTAYAESPRGFYAGVGAGSAVIAVETNVDNFFPTFVEGQDDTASELHVGYRIQRYLGVELSYFETEPAWDHLGYVPPPTDALFRGVADVHMRTTQITALGIFPFGRVWEAYVKGGVAFWDAGVNQSLIPFSSGEMLTASFNSSGEGLILGLGVGASPSPAWHLRFEYQSFEIDRDIVFAPTSTSLDTWLLLFDFHVGAKRKAALETARAAPSAARARGDWRVAEVGSRPAGRR